MVPDINAVLADLLGDDFHAAGCFTLPAPSPVPNVAALDAVAFAVRDVLEARFACTVRPGKAVMS